MVGCFAVDGVPACVERADGSHLVVALEKGTRCVVLQAFINHLGRDVNQHQFAALAQRVDVTTEGECPSAGGNNETFPLGKLTAYFMFAVAEVLFSVLCENLADAHALGLFDQLVGVHQFPSRVGGKLCADRAFSAAHKAE